MEVLHEQQIWSPICQSAHPLDNAVESLSQKCARIQFWSGIFRDFYDSDERTEERHERCWIQFQRCQVGDEGAEPITVGVCDADEPFQRPNYWPKRDVGVIGEATETERLTAAGLYPVEDLCQ